MNIFLLSLIFVVGLNFCDAGYGSVSAVEPEQPQSDVQAPAYVPNYLRNSKYSKSYTKTYSGTKTGYGGTKTGYAGTKTVYSGTKTGYGGTKTSYTGSKTWYSDTGNKAKYDEFVENANAPFEPKCDIECKHNGICVDTNTCHCPANYYGAHCEFERRPCMTYPPLPMNSMRKCTAEFCTITCTEGHRFFDGSTVANLKCADGQWQPTRADITSITDCVPECDPPCLNGGVCLSVNTCQCPQDYRGPQCQYAASVCDVRKLAFNGGYKCRGDGEGFACILYCPEGSAPNSPFANEYKCLYSTGDFTPTPVPHCVFEHVAVVTPSNYHQSGYSSSYYETQYENHTGSMTHSETNVAYGGSSGHSLKRPVHIVVQDLTPKSGSCLTWAGTHYKTFDGVIYSFQSPCQHILVRDSKDHKFTVATKAGNCKRHGYCPSELNIFLEEKEYVLSTGEDGAVIFRTTRRTLPVPATLPGIRVSMPGDTVVVNLDAVGVTVKWDTDNFILVEASVSLWNNTEGLCGNLDGNPETDLRDKDRAIVATKTALASAWQVNKIGDICESSPTETGACASKTQDDINNAKRFCSIIFSKDKFRKCSTAMDVSQFLAACTWDYCACTSSLSPEECACRTVSVFAKECLRHGVQEMRTWRDAETCPMSCQNGKVYRECGSDSQPSCALPLITSKTDNTTCVEGCFCPQGLMLEGGRCIPKSECPCRLRNKAFKPGSTVAKDCNTCSCEGGEWKCTQIPCGARCGVVGDPHYITFDGLRYDFMGHCTYTFLKTENLTIEVENVACSGAITEAMNLAPYKGEGKPSCTKAVNLIYGGATVHLKQGGLILANGNEISTLPVSIGDVLIRAASSMFVIVQLPNGVDLWWDGNTRVFVDVPPQFHDKTKGLCGTFNLNQKDDFLTPEGDTEQSALSFANKWKTREYCPDTESKEPEHPCKANVQNKEEAEKYCSKLKSALFESCHWHVDVTPFYEACLYDMCACASSPKQCLCPVLGDYAAACARRSVLIQWRYEVKECEVSCTGGQEYTVCADSCQRTCTDVGLAAARKCKPSCVEGCACPTGQVLDETSRCVPIGLCPCYHKGMKFNPGYKECRPGRRERELCTCVGARWSCVPATDADIQNYPPAEDILHNCTGDREFTACELAEPLTCKNMHLPPTSTSAECRPGCQCKKGLVLDVATKKCVLPANCPCHHGGRSYLDGHSMQEECNTCTCKSGNWTCTTRPCVGACAAWGDSHFITFDGAEYEFEGVCSYLLAKGALDGKDGFHVEIQNVPCGTTGATCSKSITLKVGRDGDEEVVSLTKHEPVPDIGRYKRIKLRIAGAFVFLDVPSLGMSVQWDRATRVYVKVDAMWQNRVKGLCGNYNSDRRDDFQAPGSGGIPESSALIFADSWRLRATCPKAQPVKEHCKQRPERNEWAVTTCGVLKQYPFTLCHSEVPPSGFISRCERDACACDAGDDCACACAALASYAQLCADRGVVVKWRSQELCPMQCDEECSNYEACVDACPPESCDNTLDYEEIKVSCQRDTCVEGCKPKKSCPNGSVYTNSSHTTCVPRATCKPICMTIGEKQVLEGELLESDACHTCHCSKGVKVCQGEPCATQTPRPIETTAHPHDEPLKCVTGWSSWISRNRPENTTDGESVENEPLPLMKEFTSGQPMCKPEMMKKIECRTVTTHLAAKETGLDVECSLERGLVCAERGNCPDFEIRVYCECGEEPFQCLDSIRPSHPHPTDCHKFYECTPDVLNPSKPHAVLKTCGDGMMYNPSVMVCDWPDSVKAVRPECGNITTTTEANIPPHTNPPIASSPLTTTVPPTTSICPPGQIYSKCAYPCDKLCHHFKKTAIAKGECRGGKKCIEGCVDESVANIKCDFGSLWRDEKTCVPVRDCTCYSNDGQIVKPGGVQVDGCLKCQCLDNDFHCDSSECVAIVVPLSGSTHEPFIMQPVVTTSTTTTQPTTTTTQPTTTTQATTTTTKATTTTTVKITEAVKMSFRLTTESILIVKSTETPPPECAEDGYKNLLWGAETLPDSSFSASSVANGLFEPQYAELNGHPMDITAGSWNPSTQDTNQWIQVELPRKEPVYGVIMQGSPLFEQYVTSYEVMYGDDGVSFSSVMGPDGEPKVFRGPLDHNNPLKQMISPPIEAKFIRIRPLTWHEEIAVRFELIGCGEPVTTEVESLASTTVHTTQPSPIQCTDALGLTAGLPVHNIEVSSNSEARVFLDIDAERGWRPLYSTPGEWILFDFTSPRNITGIKTKGGHKGWVTAYKIQYTTDLATFNPMLDDSGSTKVYPANFDSNSVVFNEFRPPIHARYLKVLPTKWKDNIEIRVEPVGCFESYPVTESITFNPASVTPTTEASCDVCPHAQLPTGGCPCGPPTRFYDGENCVTREQCPCFVGFMSYVVGSMFRGANCDECVCKLGGVTDCKPVQECKCDADLVPKLSPSCECTCNPCPEGTKICPTSKICLPLNKWCDGLQDCPDDEIGCTTSTSTTTVRSTVRSTLEPLVVTTQAPTVGVVASTTVKPKVECPKVECPPGYRVVFTTPSSSSSPIKTFTPRKSVYQRYYKGTKGGRSYTKGVFVKTYSKGGYNAPTPPQANQAFTLSKPTTNTIPPKSQVEQCKQFKCVPKLPPFKPHGSTPVPVICSVPKCPEKYTLKLEAAGARCPQYACVPPPEPPVFCELTGRTFTTFDNAQYKYDVCFHILARDTRADAWTVLVRKKCRLEGCLNQLLVRQDDQLILVKPSLMIEYDNYEYTVEQTNKICFQKNSFDVNRLGNGLVIKSRRYNFTVFYNRGGDVKIGVLKSDMGTIDGLCGAFDGDASNDRRLPNGKLATSIEQFGEAWAKPGLSPMACQTRVIPPEKQKRVWELCDVIVKEPLSHCARALNLDKWRSICLEKVCECAEQVVNNTKRTEDECRCLLLEQFVAECLATEKEADIGAWRMLNDCPANCPSPLVHYDCYRKSCEPSCTIQGGAKEECVEGGQCAAGCFCPGGTLRKGESCVPPAQCMDCVCNSLGGSKFIVFEREDLPFAGNCTYLASRDRNESGQHQYEIYVTNGPCEDRPNSICTKIVHLIYEKNIIRFERNIETKKLLMTINGAPVYEHPVNKNWITTSSDNGDVTVKLTKAFVELSVTQAKLEFEIRLPSHVYSNTTEGLCGVCAGHSDLLFMSDGEPAEDLDQYGSSWKAMPEKLTALKVDSCVEDISVEEAAECVPPPPDKNPCYNLLNLEKFGACHPLLDPQRYIESCEEDLCANKTDICSILEAYAGECRRQAVCLRWRTQELCPYTCKSPLVYQPCVNCERTCDNFETLERNPSKCQKQAVEGCFCPEGKVRVENKCIEPKTCFPCESANKTHYVGEEWQEDECTTCKCTKKSSDARAHTSCSKQVCAEPVCSENEDMIAKPKKAGVCCTEFSCVPKPRDSPECVEPKKMECGFGQVLKQRDLPNGCKEFACECKPQSECPPIPSQNDVELLTPGMERVIDNSSCCPQMQLVCRRAACPKPPTCPQFNELVKKTTIGACCDEYVCELPKDKCVVTLEWEAASKGGEKARAQPEVMLKDLDAAWLDGPCRSCRCSPSPSITPPSPYSPPTPHCSVTTCPPIVPTDQLVIEARDVPFACCPVAVAVACKDNELVYTVGQKWKSSYNVCEAYECVQQEDGKIEKVTTLQTCDTKCQPGWEYIPSTSQTECCGHCKPAACIVSGQQHKVGDRWRSPDHCANYTCVDIHGTLQVQTANETCPEVSEALRKQFVLEEKVVPGKCCKTVEPVACRVENEIYQEGQSWPTSDPCTNVTCSRDASGQLSHAAHVEACAPCAAGSRRVPRGCCGECAPEACVVEGVERKIGTTWQSSDNCTTFSCELSGETVLVTSSHVTCPDVSACDAADLYTEGCCERCREKAQALSTCNPEPLPDSDTIGLIRLHDHHHGLCLNKHPMKAFRECQGSCNSGTKYNNQTGSHDTRCECCQATRYVPIQVTLTCSDGSTRKHQVASPAQCGCRACQAGLAQWPAQVSVKPGTKNPAYTHADLKDEEDSFVPEIYRRIKSRK